jgi:hypothetical protein
MSEKEHNNNSIEQFFRRKAKASDIAYHEDDWLNLETSLDKSDRHYANRRRRRIAAAAVILLFAILGYFTYQQQQKINQLSKQLSNSEDITSLPNTIPEIIPDRTTPENDTENDQSSVAHDETEPEAISEYPVATSDQQSSSESDNEANITLGNPDITKENQQNSLTNITESSLVVTIAKASPGFDGRSPAISAIKPAKIEASQKEVDTKSQTSPSSSTFNSSETVLADREESRFSLGVLVGPDISTVGGISNFSNLGHKIGFSFEYKITKDLAFSTGAQRTNVRYTAPGGEYRLPDGYLPYGTVPGEIAAQCILIDIPLSLTYDFLHFSKSRMYATAGLSSYVMLDEDYRFNYENSQPGLPERWHEQTGTRHWMSNATISVGYEWDLQHNISLRAEPFLKVPLKEVGWGNVNLYSMGSFFSINYKW